MDNPDHPWIIVAKFNSSTDSSAKVLFQTEATLNANGTVIFEKLGVSVAMSNFKLEYYFKEPVGINSTQFNPLNVVTNPISSSNPNLTCTVKEEDLLVDENSKFNLTVALIDTYTLIQVQNISWKVGIYFLI